LRQSTGSHKNKCLFVPESDSKIGGSVRRLKSGPQLVTINK